MHALDIKSCWRVIAAVVLNEGDSANSTSVQRLTPTRIQTQAGMKTGLERKQSV